MSLLGEFALRAEPQPAQGDGSAVDLGINRAGQRLLALLALYDRPVSRSWVAGVLWSDSDDRHASWSLRSTLHRLPRPHGRSPVQTTPDRLALAADVRVDLHQLARRSTAFRPAESSAEHPGDTETLDHIRSLERDLLPDWYEDWVIIERERYHQLRLHALESLSRWLTATGRYGLAVHAALGAVQAEPLRESAHRAVIEAHLAEGNYANALRQYGACRRQLLDELAIAPSGSLQALVFGDPDTRQGHGSLSS